MRGFTKLPKCIQRTIRYIYQDAPQEHFQDIQSLVNQAIEKRRKESKKI
ncbi:hypothetical protein [Bacillus sp. AFS015802]|nr:hypothetical protein [Bacillus sp. AFS015802]